MSDTTKMPERVWVSSEVDDVENNPWCGNAYEVDWTVGSEVMQGTLTEYIRADLVTAEKSSVAQSGWVECSEMMPEDKQECMVAVVNDYITDVIPAIWDDGKWRSWSGGVIDSEYITQWMAFPPYPTEGE